MPARRQLSRIADDLGSVWPAWAAQICRAREPHASSGSAPVNPATIAEMHPGAGAGRESSTVARISATTAAIVTATTAMAMLRSRGVSRRSGVLTRRQCPSSGTANQVIG